MKITPVSFRNLNACKSNFNGNKIFNGFHSVKTEQKHQDKDFEVQQIQEKSDMVLLKADKIQQIAEIKYLQAEKIYIDWQEKTPQKVVANGITKEYITRQGELVEYFETNPDGFNKIIKFSHNKPIEITEIEPNGKKYIYVFSDDKKLARYTGGKYEKSVKNEDIVVIEDEFVFSIAGNLAIYRQNQQEITTFNRYQKMMGKHTTIDTVMRFDTIKQKPYLKAAKTEVIISPSGKRFVQNSFERGKNGELITVR